MNESTKSLHEALSTEFILGNWLVRPQLNCVSDTRNPDYNCSLEPRLMHLLCFLAANEGRVLSREQLTAELWPRVIVNENSLTRAVSELRKKLCREAGSTVSSGLDASFLETIPKKGYRLSPGVVAETQANQNVNQETAWPAAPRFRKLAGIWQPALTVASLALAMGISINQAPIAELVAPALTGYPVAIDQVINTNDKIRGAQLTLSSATQAGSESLSYLDKSRDIAPPIVSEDGKTLAFIRYQNNMSTVFLSSVESIETPIAIFSSDNRLYNLGWSPLGDALLFASQPLAVTTNLLDQPGKSADLVMIDLDTLEVKVLIDANPQAPATRNGGDINLT